MKKSKKFDHTCLPEDFIKKEITTVMPYNLIDDLTKFIAKVIIFYIKIKNFTTYKFILYDLI